jgi:hypothetical protein
MHAMTNNMSFAGELFADGLGDVMGEMGRERMYKCKHGCTCAHCIRILHR